jgi:hypothetical protein
VQPWENHGSRGGDRLAWPDGHRTIPAKEDWAHASRWHGGGWKDLNTEWSWPQEGAESGTERVPSQFNLVLLIHGATQASMQLREQVHTHTHTLTHSLTLRGCL